MRTVRRLYFYGVAAVSLNVVIWGVIGLVRTILNLSAAGLTASVLAGAIALVLVGLPVFLIHWGVAQREALKDAEERASRVRAVFLYGVLMGVLVPIVQNLLAIVNRLWLTILRLQWQPLVGQGQTWSDNLVAIAVNAAAAAYLWNILRADWQANPPGHFLVEVRRLYRYLWVIYGLGMTVFGVQQVLQFTLSLSTGIATSFSYQLANGLALVIVGTPVWVGWWWITQNALDQPGEGDSVLRLVILYLFALAGVVTALLAGILVLTTLFSLVLGVAMSFGAFIGEISAPFSVAVPMVGMWAYHNVHLRIAVESMPERSRRAGLRRLYVYILSALGLVATVLGMQQILAFIVDVSVHANLFGSGVAQRLASPLATLVVGLPLWWFNWRSMQAEAGLSDDAGDHARRSVIRKIYLYLALFAGVIAVMVSTGQLFYLLLRSLLGDRAADFLASALNWLQSSVVFGFWLGYHIRILQLDGRMAAKSLAARHALYPVLVLDNGDGSFSQAIAEALKRQAPAIPVAIQLISQGIPAVEITTARAVVLPSDLAAHPPEAFRLWLNDYQGERVVVPATEAGWLWIGAATRSPRDMAQQTAQAIRQMAEGLPVRFAPLMTGVMIAALLVGGAFIMPVVGVAIALIISVITSGRY